MQSRNTVAKPKGAMMMSIVSPILTDARTKPIAKKTDAFRSMADPPPTKLSNYRVDLVGGVESGRVTTREPWVNWKKQDLVEAAKPFQTSSLDCRRDAVKPVKRRLLFLF